jgi:hypothetical protein
MVNLVDIKFLGNMMYCVNLYDVLCWLADKECLRWVIVIPMKPVWPWIIISHQMFTALTQSFKTSEADALWNHGPVMVCFLPFISCLNVLVGSIPLHPRVMYISIYIYIHVYRIGWLGLAYDCGTGPCKSKTEPLYGHGEVRKVMFQTQ